MNDYLRGYRDGLLSRTKIVDDVRQYKVLLTNSYPDYYSQKISKKSFSTLEKAEMYARVSINNGDAVYAIVDTTGRVNAYTYDPGAGGVIRFDGWTPSDDWTL